MTDALLAPADATLDLVLERDTDVAPARLWRGWTEPGLLVRWFTPAPWRTVACEIDLRPGGVFATTMRSPDGEEHGGAGCFLEVVPTRRLVWTSALGPGLRPLATPPGGLAFTASIEFEPRGGGTRYRARTMHVDAESCRAHAAMGFHEGWGRAFEQLVELARTLP